MTVLPASLPTIPEYDRQARANYWHPEALFGLVYEYVHPGDTLLDVGIGTGLASVPFVKAGVKVYGLDADPEMLALCKAKVLAAELMLHDLGDIPWPYTDAVFDHVLACGVLHFLADIEPVFGEVRRLLRPNGTFIFTTKAPPSRLDGEALPQSLLEETIQGTTLYLHPRSSLSRLMAACGFELLKELRLLVKTGRHTEDVFCAFVARKGL